MELYDNLINDIFSTVGECRVFGFDEKRRCDTTEAGAFILSKEMAFEFGAQPLPALNAVLYTTDKKITDQIMLKGADIGEIGSDTPYARITVVSLNENEMPGDDGLYKRLKDIEFTKYHFYPADCLLRESPESKREQLRISKKAVLNGLSLENIGCGFIAEYKKDPLVKNISVIFVTDKSFDYKKLTSLTSKADAVTQSLNKILEGLEISCDTCELKSICDEVEGLRQLHFGKER